jgi:transmembrane sensor
MKFKGPIELLHKYLAGNATPEEIKSVEQWYGSFEEKKSLPSSSGKDLHKAKEAIYRELVNELNMAAPVIPLYKRVAFRVSAAASFLLLMSGAYFLFFREPTHLAIAANIGQKPNNDIVAPSTNKATLTLADGTKVLLDSTGNGTLAVQGKTNIIKEEDGLISYKGKASADDITFNTLSVPKGSKPMKLLLEDGSLVWLNVASSITYPTAFSGAERSVEITGEVYFEIARNKEKPFVVKKKNDDTRVKVPGTHFNVNAYDDEADLKITVLEGSVDVSKGSNHTLLKPGQQAQVSRMAVKLLNTVDIENVMAWKNGRFYFDGADIKTVMRQVEKWYNVDITYESEIPYSFVAKISRNVNASELLKVLQLTELVHFKIEGNKITVMK